MAEMIREELLHMEEVGAEQGWVSLLSKEDKEYFAYQRTIFKRYGIVPSKATRLEYDFVVRVEESEFYLQQRQMPDQFKQPGQTTTKVAGRGLF